MSAEILSQWAGTAAIGLLVWSLKRNVDGLDKRMDSIEGRIGSMASKVDELHKAETAMQVRVAELSVRMQHTESMLAGIELELEKLRGGRREHA
jgi:predicted  nucleic acid-binding Zn-ribbon protein